MVNAVQCVCLKTAKMAGRLGPNGRSVRLHVEQAPSKEAGHVMPQVTPAVAPPFKPVDATWENATVVSVKMVVGVCGPPGRHAL